MTKKGNATKTDSDDQALFRAAMQDVAPLPAPDRIVVSQQRPSPRPKRNNRVSDEITGSCAVSLEIETDGEWSFLRPGVSRQTLRRLRKGYWTIQSSLDLHGLTQDAARQELALFLDDAISNSYRCICIIHGKGLSSVDRVPVLKHRIGGWLAEYEAVLAFCQAGPQNGGSGAVLVLLKK